jgi:hypothetical protein
VCTLLIASGFPLLVSALWTVCPNLWRTEYIVMVRAITMMYELVLKLNCSGMRKIEADLSSTLFYWPGKHDCKPRETPKTLVVQARALEMPVFVLTTSLVPLVLQWEFGLLR